MPKSVTIGGVTFGGDGGLAFILGPCQLESRSHALKLVELIDAAVSPVGRFVFKASFDKANRTRREAARGVGLDAAIPIFQEIRRAGYPVLTDVHLPEHCEILSSAAAVDALQIPAFLSRQTDLLLAAAATGLPVNVKKGQFMAPDSARYIVDKVGQGQVLLTERGTTFGHGDLVVDFRGFPVMSAFAPVVFDATHSVQRANASGFTGGDRQFIAPLARAAVAARVSGVFIETHENPDRAPSDAGSMLPIGQLPGLVRSLSAIHDAARGD